MTVFNSLIVNTSCLLCKPAKSAKVGERSPDRRLGQCIPSNQMLRYLYPKLINPKNENEADLNGCSARPKTRYSLVGALLYFVTEFYLQVWMHFVIRLR